MYGIALICTAVIVVVASAPVNEDAQARILEYEFTNDGSGNYRFRYVTSNDIEREETGLAVNAGNENGYIAVQGTYSYIDGDDRLQFVRYTADENGYHILPAKPPSAASYSSSALPAAVIGSLLGG